MLKKHCGLIVGLTSITIFTSCALFATGADQNKNKLATDFALPEQLTQQTGTKLLTPVSSPISIPQPQVATIANQAPASTPAVPEKKPAQQQQQQQPDSLPITQQPILTEQTPVVQPTPIVKPLPPTPVKQKTTKTRAS